jgi:hypothetical protein
MKKMLFGLIATVMLSVSGNAQIETKEDARVYAAKVMIEFKNALQPAYTNSKSFEDFIKNSTGPYNPQGKITTVGQNMLKAAYGFLSNKTTDKNIINTYNGLEVAQAFKYLKDNPNLSEGSIFGITSDITKNVIGEENVIAQNMNYRCCFFCLRCHLHTVFGEEAGEVILDGIVQAILILIKTL